MGKLWKHCIAEMWPTMELAKKTSIRNPAGKFSVSRKIVCSRKVDEQLTQVPAAGMFRLNNNFACQEQGEILSEEVDTMLLKLYHEKLSLHNPISRQI